MIKTKKHILPIMVVPNLKNTKMYRLNDWMSKFYAARIVLEDNIQLLEALGVIIRN